MNIFVDREFAGRESTRTGFAQSAEVPVLLPEEKLGVGLEMQYRGGGVLPGRNDTTKGLVIGPTLAWRPTKRARFAFSPLIGCSEHTPAVEVVVCRNPILRNFYLRLRAAGKPAKLALMATMRKLLIVLNTALKTDLSYV